MTPRRSAPYHGASMLRYHQSGQANLTAILSLLGLVVSGVWVWKRLSPDMQDLIIDQALPLAALLLVLLTSVWILVKKIKARSNRRKKLVRLMAQLEKLTSPQKRLDLAFAMIELNEYRRAGLEPIAPQLQRLLIRLRQSFQEATVS